ncbi:MAG: cytosine permease [Phycisphaerae bacterium]|jgi:cytosine permease|nr:cytosine permease [Phycisphaerae bacterium]
MASNLPDYVASATPIPQEARAPWYKNTAQTYAGIMLWFVFWSAVPLGDRFEGGAISSFAGGTLSQGLLVGLGALIAAALACHFLFYVVPGMLGMKTGLPLYIVGTSTYGVQGGFLMPGFLMGLLQFGWVAVNAFFAAVLLCAPFGYGAPSLVHAIVAIVWASSGMFIGLKGIKYVARVATFLPLVPLAILVILFVSTIGGLGDFDSNELVQATQAAALNSKPALSIFGVFAILMTYAVGFFATAGAAGVDFGMNNRNKKDVQLGGLVGIALSTVFAGGMAMLIVAGAYGAGTAGTENGVMDPTALMGGIIGSKAGAVCMWLLALAAFPTVCISSFIAANCFKTTLPKVNPFISCGIGTAAACVLAVTGWAGDVMAVFGIIGASFGPVCGSMMADYLLAGRKWAGPRAGWNLAGWISWVIGFAVGSADVIAKIPGLEALAGKIPCPPVAAFVIGLVLYVILAKVGMETKVMPMNAESEA